MTKTFNLKAIALSLALGLIASFVLVLTPQVTQADTLNDVITGGLKASLVKNTKIRTSINGDVLVEDSRDKIKATYQIIGASQVDNTCGLTCGKESHQFTFKTSIKLEDLDPNPTYPAEFESLNITAKVSMLAYNGGKDLYLRWDDLTVSASGVPEREQADYQMILGEVESAKNTFANQWYYFNQEELWSEYGLTEEELGMVTSEELTAELLEIIETSGDEEGRVMVMKLAQTVVDSLKADETITEEDGQLAMDVLEELMSQKMGRTFEIVSGNNEGFSKWNLDRFMFMRNVEGMMQQFAGEKLSDYERNEMMDFLKSMRVAFWYRLDENGVMDIFLGYFELKDFEGLDFFNLRYRSQMWGQGQANVQDQPTDAVSFGEFMEEVEAF